MASSAKEPLLLPPQGPLLHDGYEHDNESASTDNQDQDQGQGQDQDTASFSQQGQQSCKGENLSSAHALYLKHYDSDSSEYKLKTHAHKVVTHAHTGYNSETYRKVRKHRAQQPYRHPLPRVHDKKTVARRRIPRPRNSIGAAASSIVSKGAPLPPLVAPVVHYANSTMDEMDDRHRCAAYCFASDIDLDRLAPVLSRRSQRCTTYRDGLQMVLHTSPIADDVASPDGRSSSESSREMHAFLFSYGCLVTWGWSEAAELDFIAEIKSDYADGLLEEDEVDDFAFVYAHGSKITVTKDVVQLQTTEVTEKLAISFALAQSAKLGVFELDIEQTIEETREIPERMAQSGNISLTRRDITKRIGVLFVHRASINLHSDVLDHPEFFWEDDTWLAVYMRASKYLEVERRVEVLNKRLDLMKELFEMLANELHTSHSHKLEWIVIILILLEVFFQIMELVF